MNPTEGEILVIDKPLGWSSFHVVKKLRGALTARLRKAGCTKLKVGHAGTLDPLASGVMILCTGKATKQIDTLQAGVKEYIATVGLGATTPSFDLETPFDSHASTEHITRELVDETLSRFIGPISQVPPTYSACKVDGKRAYKAARTGQEIELKPKLLVIDAIEVLEFRPDELTLKIRCSKGTYIRALARDIGEALNCGGYLKALRRTQVGNYTLTDALSINDALRKIWEEPMEITLPEGESPVEVPAGVFVPMETIAEADIKPFDQRH